jgi:hypothetical protein
MPGHHSGSLVPHRVKYAPFKPGNISVIIFKRTPKIEARIDSQIDRD